MMKKTLILLFCFVFFFTGCIGGGMKQYHSGRTDANGCHGGSQPYHCHGGSGGSSSGGGSSEGDTAALAAIIIVFGSLAGAGLIALIVSARYKKQPLPTNNDLELFSKQNKNNE